MPYLSRSLVDEALLGRSFDALVRIVGLFVAMTAGSFVLNVMSGLRYTQVSADILFDMRLAVYRHLQRMSPRFFARRPLGDIMSRINNDVGEIQRVLSDTALAWLGNVAFLVGTVAMLVWLDWRLFLVAALVLPPAAVATLHYRRRLEAKVTVMRERSADVGTFLIETIRGMRLVVASNAGEREARRFRARNDAFVDALMDMTRLRYFAGGLPGLLLSAGTAVVFLYGGRQVIDGALTLGTFTAFMAYQMRLLGPVQALMGLYTGLATARVSLRRVHELLDEPAEVVDRPGAQALARVSGSIAFEGVGCDHGRGEAVLRDVTFRIEPGQVVALVGASGSGKSTVADLLVRHIEVDRGSIRLDGTDIRDLPLADLREHVAVVDQDTFVFNASLKENIRYAKPDASDAEVEQAARDAGLDPLVARLPEGLDTPAGEHGLALSTGERQRVSVARALLADPAVLILDEATGALDPASEARVVQGYAQVMKGRTTLVISHRRDLVEESDRVLVLVDGRVAQDGTHEELEAQSGPYRSIFRLDPATA